MLRENIPRDIRKYKTKFIGSFTLRQVICFTLASIVAIILWNAQIQLGLEPQYIGCLPASIPLLFIFEVQELPFEKYVSTVLINNLTRPSTRVYKTNNLYAQFTTNEPIDKKKETDEKEIKKKRPVNSKRIKKQAAKESEEYIGYK